MNNFNELLLLGNYRLGFSLFFFVYNASGTTNNLMKVAEIVKRVKSVDIVEKFQNPQLFHQIDFTLSHVNDDLVSNGSFKDVKTDTQSVQSFVSRVYRKV